MSKNDELYFSKLSSPHVWTDSSYFLIFREGDPHAAESLVMEFSKMKKKLLKLEEFANNEHTTQFQSTTDYPGGYSAALRDLKQLLGE